MARLGASGPSLTSQARFWFQISGPYCPSLASGCPQALVLCNLSAVAALKPSPARKNNKQRVAKLSNTCCKSSPSLLLLLLKQSHHRAHSQAGASLGNVPVQIHPLPALGQSCEHHHKQKTKPTPKKTKRKAPSRIPDRQAQIPSPKRSKKEKSVAGEQLCLARGLEGTARASPSLSPPDRCHQRGQ